MALESLAQEIADQAGGAFAGFQRDVAGESVGHDDIDAVGGNIAAFDKADEIEFGARGFARNQIVGVANFGAAFVFFGADVQKSDPGVFQPKTVAGVRPAHQRVLQKIAFVGADVGADIQHHVEAAGVARRPEAGDGGAIDARQFAQAQHRHRHERAGVAARDNRVGFAVFHGVDGGPHRGALAVAHDVAGLGVHRDDFGDIADLATLDQAALCRSERRKHRPSGPMHHERDVGIFLALLAMPATTADGPWSPPIASTEISDALSSASGSDRMDPSSPLPGAHGRRLRRVVVQVDLVGLSDHFAVVIVTTSTANVVRALQLAAIRAFAGFPATRAVVCTAHVAARLGDFILWDSHVSSSVNQWGHAPRF